MVASRIFRASLALLAGLTALAGPMRAHAQTADGEDPRSPEVRRLERLEQMRQVDPCSEQSGLSATMRMSLGCVGDLSPDSPYRQFQSPAAIGAASPLTDVPLLTADDVRLTGLLPRVELNMPPMDLQTPCGTIVNAPTTQPDRAFGPPVEPRVDDVIVVTGRRPCDAEAAAIGRAHQAWLEEQFGNQPTWKDNLYEQLSSPFGRFASSWVATMGLRSLSGEARDAAVDAIGDELDNLFLGGADSCQDPMEDLQRRRDREFMGQFMAQQRGYIYDPCSRR